MDKVRVGLIGVGLQGLGHLHSYRALPNAELVALADVAEDKVRCLSEQYGVPRWHMDYRELLADDSIVAVSIALPDHLHFEPTMTALKAGKHVLLEKPMALRVSEAEQVAATAEEKGLQLMVNFSHRHQLPTVALKERLDKGEFGEPIYAYARLNNTLFVPTKMLSWSINTALPHWLMTHEVDRIRWFFGCEAKKVYAVAHRGVLQGMGLDTADLYHATIEFESGAIASVESTWILPESAPFVADCRTHFVCTRAWLDIDHSEPVLKVATPEKYSHPGILGGTVRGEPVGTVFEAVKHFVNCVRSGEPTDVTPADGVAVTRIVCAIIESAEKGEAVSV